MSAVNNINSNQNNNNNNNNDNNQNNNNVNIMNNNNNQNNMNMVIAGRRRQLGQAGTAEEEEGRVQAARVAIAQHVANR